MNNSTNEIICPNCHTPISIDDVLTRHIENKLKQEFDEKKRLFKDALDKELR
jgi:hypothetical protein